MKSAVEVTEAMEVMTEVEAMMEAMPEVEAMMESEALEAGRYHMRRCNCS